MKEIIYRCDVCKEKKENKNTYTYTINNGVITILIDTNAIRKNNNHICDRCIGIIYRFEHKRQHAEG